VACGRFLEVRPIFIPSATQTDDYEKGNFYSIENDYDKPARIFFSQGCEILNESIEGGN